jgi:ATP-dependent DNA helicase RecQ
MDMEYSSLRTNDRTMDILRTNGEKVELRKYILEAKTKTKRSRKRKQTSLTNESDLELLDELKDLRYALARKEKMPPYRVFNDKSLLEMVTQKPKTLEEMAEVSGVGDYKLKKYGKIFIDIISS